MGSTRLQDVRLYTIGWVAALSKELTAAKAMLDENHDQPTNFRQNLSDTNNYTWGRVGKHNIVIASLPEGRYGLVSAAVTASFMISSLPHLRFGLMVGIGAGIPRPGKDIRLGDVVVSTPAGEHPGVVQYDLGKLESDGRFKRVGSLAPPPRILLTALTNLKATQPLEGSQMPFILDAMIERYPLLRYQQHGYFHQGSQNDRLFMASSVHVGDDDASQPPFAPTAGSYLRLVLGWLWSLLLFLCTARWRPTQSPLRTGSALSYQTKAAPPQAITPETCARCDTTKEIQRPTRPNNHSIVHYGVIASGNIVVKDGLSRDAILDRLGPECICFEMEAAGLMDNFPCLVIRGICDYANNHKSDQWQNYAAATAAAYAKELLVGYIRAEDVQNADGIEELMGRVAKDTSQIAKTTTVTQEAVQKLHDSDQYQKIMKWLSPPDTSSSYQTALETRQTGTGQWFLDNEMYSAWKSTPRSSLWIHGIPGCGKTILSSTVIENLSQSEPNAGLLLYYYFSFAYTERQSLNGALRSLIAQLSAKSKQAESCLITLFESRYKKDFKRLKTNQLCDIFEQMASKVEGLWIVLDALDECQTREDPNNVTKGLLTWLKNLASLHTMNARILVTSRPVYDIESSLKTYVTYQIPLQSHLVTDDIQAYVHSVVRQSTALARWAGYEEIQREIEDHLVEKAQGMFRWVACQLDALKPCKHYPELRGQLRSLPKTLDETYKSILENVPQIHDKVSKKLLQFLVFSERTLSLEEALEIVAVQPEQPRPRFDPKNRMPIPEEITTYFQSLVVIVEQKERFPDRTVKQVQLAHFSVKEYLLSHPLSMLTYSQPFEGQRALQELSMSMAETCLAYLLEVNSNRPESALKQSHPLASYASLYWAAYARRAGNSMDQSSLKSSLIRRTAWSDFDSFDSFNSFDSYDPFDSFDCSNCRYPTSFSSLASLGRFKREDDSILANTPRFGEVNAKKRSAREAFGRDLCDHPQRAHNYDCLTSFETFEFPTATEETPDDFPDVLYYMSYNGMLSAVYRILEKNPSAINKTFGGYGTALHAASNQGHTEVVQALLDKGANAGLCHEICGTALEQSVAKGHNNTTKVLIEQESNLKDERFGNILMRAVVQRDTESVQLLVNHGVDVEAEEDGKTALQAACAARSESIVDLLLQKGADPDRRDLFHSTPLMGACLVGSESIAELLLQNGADVNAEDPFCRTAVCIAASRGHVNVVRTLLHHGADLSGRSRSVEHPLEAACCSGHYDVAQLLLEPAGTKKILDKSLAGAIVHGREVIVRLLLDAGADPDADDSDYHFGNSILEASCRRQKDIVTMLLKRGSRIDPGTGTERNDYCKALYAASRHDLDTVVQMLLSVCERAEYHIPPARREFNFHELRRKQRIDNYVDMMLKNGAMDLDSLKALGKSPKGQEL